MSDSTTPPRRRLFDRASGAPTLVGAGSRFEGRLQAAGPLTVSGEIVGDGDVQGLLSIAEGAHWAGNVRAETAVVTGRVTGDLLVAGKLEIGRTAVIRGNVHAKSLAIANGATVDGELRVTGSEPVVRFEEKRTPGA